MVELSRRKLLGASGLVTAGAAFAQPRRAAAAPVRGKRLATGADRLPTALGAFGANFNQNLDSVHFGELEIARAGWIRGFFAMPWVDEGDPADHYAIKTILAAGERGYGTLLSLKFPYNRISFPAPGSEAMKAELARLDQVLPLVLGKADILTVGNEPFIESVREERDERLNVFYETVARHVIEYREARCGPRCSTRVYLGALNRLDLPGHRTPAVERYVEFARQTPEVEGVDIHLHLPDPAASRAFLDYLLPRMRPDQTFLATEFSLVWHWKDHLSDRISRRFADRYGYSRDALVWQVIRAAIEHPVRQEEWDAFLASCAWYEESKHFLRYLVNGFRQTGRLAVATYDFRQDTLMVGNFGPDKNPWLLNSVFAPYTVRPWKDGTTGRGYGWIDDFRRLQRGRGDRAQAPRC